MLGLLNDWVGMWMGQVLQRLLLQARVPFKLVRGCEYLADVGWSAEVEISEYLFQFLCCLKDI